ncbi:MAG: hypothetical protein Q4Q53_04115 [Methanocorpusculum sp.]|nr:hypothetical protein [Methanocorpusculum sp.]
MDSSQETTKNISVAMELFNSGKYSEVINFASGTSDSALLLLAARSYTQTGQYDTAEYLLKDLIRQMPNSSYLHGYLAKVYEKTGSEKAEKEYAAALALDSENRLAIAGYAEVLLSKNDLRGAIPLLRALVRIENNDSDIRKLMQILTSVGEPAEAITLHLQNFGENSYSKEYLEALIESKEYQKALNIALTAWNTTKDTAYLRLDLEALASLDPKAAESAYRSALDSFEEENLDDENVSSIRFSYILLEKLLENFDAAKYELDILTKTNDDPVYKLLDAELESKMGNGEKANKIYRCLIDSVCSADEVDYASAELVIDRFVNFLGFVRTKEEVAGIISVILSKYPVSVCLSKIARAYEEADSSTQAKDWYYRAYRADFVRGGIAYAKYLRRTHQDRECETVIRYILMNASKMEDIEYASKCVLNCDEEIYKLSKARDMVLKKLASVSDSLSSVGREMLSAGYLYSAMDSFECQDYEGCKWYCLAGIDVLPCYPEKISVNDFMDVLSRAKGRALVERPVLLDKAAAELQIIDDGEAEEILPDLDEREKKAVEFLKEHREATEMDLRAILETRRVAGIINGIMDKTSSVGILLIEKRGVGERGEIYGYIGK